MARSHPPAGIPVDSSGNATVDPTKNVLDLVEAAVKRIDDMADLRAQLSSEKVSRVEQAVTYQDRIAMLRAEHSKEIRLLESDRLDKIRQVDVLAGNTAADRALIAIQTLDRTTQANAETLRSMVANTATTIAKQTADMVQQQNDRIAALEKSSYTGAGKGEGIGMSWGVILSVVGVIGTLLVIGGVLVTVVLFLTRAPAPVYAPAPSGTVLPSTPSQTPPR